MRAVENALKITIPDNARLIRNLITGSLYVHDHVIHFYHLQGLDWVDIVSALKADPAKTSSLAQSISDWPQSSTAYFKGMQNKLKAFVESGQLGPFANAYWGHPAYKMPPEANLMAASHYVEALGWQRDIIRIHALLGSKNPHVQTHLVGGMALPIDPNSQNALNTEGLAFLRGLVTKAHDFVSKVYIPDLFAIASFYKEWASRGPSVGNLMSYGEFPNSAGTGDFWLPSGVIKGKNLDEVDPVDQTKITEYVTHSWYEYKEGNAVAKHPWFGETDYRYSGPKPPYDSLNTDQKYSWVKTPHYEDMPMEVGPLARMLVAYASGHQRIREVIDMALNKLDLEPEHLFSTLGRIAARAIETLVTAEMLPVWVDGLAANMKKGDLTIHNGEKWEPSTWPKEAKGYGLMEAPRGSLGHWVMIKDRQIERYQCVVPSTWNSCPRDSRGRRGPYESSLIGTPVVDPDKPLEILRTIHSFDPCMACAVHLMDAGGKEMLRIKVA